MPKFVRKGDAPDLSPMRIRRAQLQERLNEVQAAVDEQLAKAARLDPVHTNVASAKTALSNFDAQQASDMTAFAEGIVASLPKVAGAVRAELAAEVADAESASTAATAAQEKFRAEAGRISMGLAPLQIELAEAGRLILLEDASELLPKVREAIATAWKLSKEIDAARFAVVNGADISGATELGRALMEFDAARRVAEAKPRDDDDPAHVFHEPEYARQMRADTARIMSMPKKITAENVHTI